MPMMSHFDLNNAVLRQRDTAFSSLLDFPAIVVLQKAAGGRLNSGSARKANVITPQFNKKEKTEFSDGGEADYHTPADGVGHSQRN